jgi:hypothetical protein
LACGGDHWVGGVGERAADRVWDANDSIGADIAGGDPIDAEAAALAPVDVPLDVGLGAHRARLSAPDRSAFLP